MLTLVRYRSWFPPFVAVGRAMVRYRGLTGKIPVETFKQNVSHYIFTSYFQTDDWMVYCKRNPILAHLDGEIELRADVIKSLNLCYHWSGCLGHIEIDV